MVTKDEFDDALRLAGGLPLIADQMGESRQTVLNWRARGVPANRCRLFASLTGLALQSLRDDWADYWPELGSDHPTPQVATE